MSRYHDYVRRGEVDRYLKALGYAFRGRITYSSIQLEDEEQEGNEDEILFEHEENGEFYSTVQTARHRNGRFPT